MFDNPLIQLTLGLAMSWNDTSGPTPAQYATGIDPFLTEIAVQDLQADQDFITPQIFPIVNVDAPAGSFKVWNRGSLLRPEFRDHAYGDRPVLASYKTDQGVYSTVHRSLGKAITPTDRASAFDPLEPEKGAVSFITTQARLDIDLRWTDAYFKDGVWSWQYQGVNASPDTSADTPEFLQFDQPGVKVAQFVRGRAERMRRMTGTKPNVLVVGADVHACLIFDEDIVDRVKYTQKGIADADLLAAFFDVQRYIVAGGVHNDAKEGQADTFEYNVEPDGMLLCFAAPRPSKDVPSAGYTFNWRRLHQAFEGEQNPILNELAIIRRVYNSESGNIIIQGHHATGINIVAPDLGMYFKNVVGKTYSGY